MIIESIQSFIQQTIESLVGPFLSWESFLFAISGGIRAVRDFQSKTAWPYMLSSILIAWLIFVTAKKRKFIDSKTSFVAFVFPRDVYRHPSAMVDYKYVAIDLSIQLLLYIPLISAFSMLVHKTTVHAVAGAFGLDLQIGGAYKPGVIAAIVAIIVGDFQTFLAHYILHKIPTLWCFHQVHHSAEVLTPVTVYRIHPVETLIYAIIGAVTSGVAAATYTSLSDDNVHPVTLLGVNIIAFLFFAFAFQLRHSHIWLSYGPLLSYVFLSPAQHQIHHSIDPKHWEKNFGLIFAIWDALLGTLYIPQSHENLRYGLPGSDPRDFSSVHKLYFKPFAKAARGFLKHRNSS